MTPATSEDVTRTLWSIIDGREKLTRVLNSENHIVASTYFLAGEMSKINDDILALTRIVLELVRESEESSVH